MISRGSVRSPKVQAGELTDKLVNNNIPLRGKEVSRELNTIHTIHITHTSGCRLQPWLTNVVYNTSRLACLHIKVGSNMMQVLDTCVTQHPNARIDSISILVSLTQC